MDPTGLKMANTAKLEIFWNNISDCAKICDSSWQSQHIKNWLWRSFLKILALDFGNYPFCLLSKYLIKHKSEFNKSFKKSCLNALQQLVVNFGSQCNSRWQHASKLASLRKLLWFFSEILQVWRGYKTLFFKFFTWYRKLDCIWISTILYKQTDRYLRGFLVENLQPNLDIFPQVKKKMEPIIYKTSCSPLFDTI